MYIKTKNLPEYIRKLFRKVGMNKREVELVRKTEVAISSKTSRGDLAYNIVVDLRGDETTFISGGSDQKPKELTEHEVLIHGRTGDKAWAVLYAHPNCSYDFLPKIAEVNDFERNVLLIYRCAKGDMRESALQQTRHRQESEKSLIEKGLLSFTANGIRITTAGKNALEEYRE